MAENIFSKQNKYKKNEATNVDGSNSKEIVIGVLERVSSDMQVEGDSLEMQRELAEEHANNIKGIIYKYYTEEGVSASKIRIEKRQAIQELVQDIRDGKINYVIAYKRDRMFRNTQEYMWFIQLITDNDCDIYLSARGESQIDLSAFKQAGAGKMIEVVMSMVAEMESATIASRVSDTMISKAARGERTGGRLPVGYKWENEKLVPIDGAVEIINIIEEHYLNGIGVKSIARWLNGGDVKGLRTLDSPLPKPSVHSKSDEWNQRNIKTILFNPIYTGHNSYQSRKNPDLERIIEVAPVVVPIRSMERQAQIFELQVKKVEEKKPPRAYTTPFLLTGLIYCGECGELLRTQTSQKKEGTRYSYYKCKHRNTDKAKKCKMGRIYRKEILEKLVIEVSKEKLKELLDTDTYEIFREKSSKEKEFVNSQIEMVKEKIIQLNKDMKEYANMVIELKDDPELKRFYLEEQKKIVQEIKLLNDSQEKLSVELEQEEKEEFDFGKFLSVANDFSKVIDDASIGMQKQILENLFSKIYLDNEGEIRLEFKMGVRKSYSEKFAETITEKVEGKVPSFISLSTIRDSRVPKDTNERIDEKTIVINVINDWTSSFNYFHTLKRMFEKARISFYPFLCELDECFDIRNANLINEGNLTNYVQASKPKHIDSHKRNTYIQQKLEITKSTRTRIIYGHLPPYKKLVMYLSKMDSSVKDFLKYVKSNYEDFIIGEETFEEIEATVNSKSIKTEFLFTDLIKCKKCGNNFVGKKEGKGVRYSCIKNHPTSKYRCYSTRVSEPILISAFEEETKLKVNRELLKEMIDVIYVLENDKPIINYKLEKSSM